MNFWVQSKQVRRLPWTTCWVSPSLLLSASEGWGSWRRGDAIWLLWTEEKRLKHQLRTEPNIKHTKSNFLNTFPEMIGPESDDRTWDSPADLVLSRVGSLSLWISPSPPWMSPGRSWRTGEGQLEKDRWYKSYFCQQRTLLNGEFTDVQHLDQNNLRLRHFRKHRGFRKCRQKTSYSTRRSRLYLTEGTAARFAFLIRP